MKEDNKNASSVMEVPESASGQKPEHIITAEISVEVAGDKKPDECDKMRDRCGAVEFWSLIILILSALFFFFIDMNACAFWIAAVSGLVFGVACGCDISALGSKGHSPWWYGAL